tara:strand:- start:162 stop:1202 length:1041 start_codon:yes stop_codon:yes gene_type:complete
MFDNIIKYLINDYETVIKPILIPSELTEGTGICNPSILVEEDKIHLIIRHVEYTLYICENEQKYQSANQGPISYYHREDKNELKTNNYYCELDKDSLEITRYHKIDTSKLDVEPIWTFVGLEDARLVKWSKKYYLCGVRRDTTTNGKGRMELSEIEIKDDSVKEINRSRIEVENKNSYCEKNWMPVLTEPYHFVKWSDPTEVVKVDMKEKYAERITLKEKKYNTKYDIRGGTPLIEWFDETYLCITHEVDFTLRNINGHKNASYYHRFVIFNKDYEIIQMTEPFNFMTGRIEFCIGMDRLNDEILIAFSFQDNGSYIIRIKEENLKEFIQDVLKEEDNYITNTNEK